MITARYLGPANYGLLNYAISVVSFVTPIMRLGLTSIFVHETIQEPEKEGETLGTSLALSVFSALICIVGANLFVFISHGTEQDTIVVTALYSTVLLFQAFEIINYWFQAKLLAKYCSILSLIAYIIVSGYKVFILASHKSIYWFAVANVLDFFLIAIGLCFLYKNKGNQKLSFSTIRAKKLLNRSKYYIISDLMVVIFAQTDRIMLKGMLSNEATGFYSAAVTCAGITNFVFAAIIDSMRPTILESKAESEETYRKKLSWLVSIIVYLSLLQCIVMTVFSSLIIHVIYGDAYAAAAPALQIVVWYITFSYFGAVRNIWILAEGKQKSLLPINLIGALANVALNAAFIPIWGINGAAIASLVTQFMTNIITGYVFPSIRGVNNVLLKGLDPHNLVEIKKVLLLKKD